MDDESIRFFFTSDETRRRADAVTSKAGLDGLSRTRLWGDSTTKMADANE